MERGRYLEVTYSLKIAASGSLSSDVTVELPCRIVNFVSLDPPPGHAGSHTTAAAHTQTTAQSPATSALGGSRAVERMASMESLSILDLNRMYGVSTMVRGHSYGSATSGQTSSSGMSRAHTIAGSLASIEEDSPPVASNANETVQHIQDRQVRHQMSLECIGSAIASATARRQGHVRTQSALSITHTAEAISDEDDDKEPLSPMDQIRAQYSSYPTPLPEPEVVQLDDLDEIPDGPLPDRKAMEATPASFGEHVQVHTNDWLEYEDESEDEVDLVLQTKHFDSDEDNENRLPADATPVKTANSGARRGGLLSPTKASTQRAVISPSLASGRSAPNSPSFVRSPIDSDALRLSDKSSRGPSFSVASPSSPVKKGQAFIVSPKPAQARRQPDRLAPPRPESLKSPLSPRTASAARRAKPVPQLGSPASVKGRVAALERGTVQIVRKSASLATLQGR